MAARKIPLGAQIALAALLGLAAFETRALVYWSSEHMPIISTKALFVVHMVTTPGGAVGRLGLGTLDGYGLVQDTQAPVDKRYPLSLANARRIEEIISALSNMLIFGALWFMLHSGEAKSRRRRVAKWAVVVWLVFTVPLALLGSMWMT